MCGRLLKAMSALSLLAGATVAAVWGRSLDGRTDCITLTRAAVWSLCSKDGLLYAQKVFVLGGPGKVDIVSSSDDGLTITPPEGEGQIIPAADHWTISIRKDFYEPEYRHWTWRYGGSMSPQVKLGEFGWRKTEVRFVAVPCWTALCVTSILPAVYLLGLCIRSRCRRWRQARTLCTSCGYNLTGNTSGICPECGRPIDRPAAAAEETPPG